MEFTITKEQILEVASWGNSQNKKQIKEWFPEAFKTELEVGKWYYNEKYNIVFYLEEFKYDNVFNGYGFNKDKEWFSNNKYVNIYAEYCSRKATHEEIESALIAEAKKRGFLEGAKFKSSLSENGKIRTVREGGVWDFYMPYNTLNISTPENEWGDAQSNPTVFKDGIWATIIPEEKTTISKEKALKILAKKLKVSPESIEIK